MIGSKCRYYSGIVLVATGTTGARRGVHAMTELSRQPAGVIICNVNVDSRYLEYASQVTPPASDTYVAERRKW